jgi:chemotaxis signal transduction protein
LDSRRADAGDNSTRYALIIGAGSEPVGLLVDRLLGQREIVVQPLIDPLLHVPGVAAATQLGNGQVVLVLDPAALMAGRQAASIRRRPASRGLALPGGVPRLAEQGGSTRPASIVSSTDVQGEEMSSASQLQAEPFILFRLADTTYAVRSEAVQHVDMVGQITPIPDAPPFLDGVALVRGQMIPAINLRVRFGFERIPYDLAARLVVVRTAGRTVGLIVDAAREFLAIAAGAIQPPPEPVSDLSGDWVEGIAALGDRMVVVLNIDEVIRLADAVPQGGSAEGAPVQED